MRISSLAVALALSGSLVAATPISAAFDLVFQPAINPAQYDVVANEGKECSTIIECLQNEKRFSKLVRFLEKHGDTLRNELERDEAFERLDQALESIRESRRRRRHRSSQEEEFADSESFDTEGRRKDRKRCPRLNDEDDDMNSEGRRKGRKRHPRLDDDADDDDKLNDPRRRKDRDEDKHEMQELLEYHVVEDNVHRKDLYEGKLLRTKLKLDELDGKRQRVRVMEFNDEYYLNFHSRVEENIKLRPKNGRILAISRVLSLPLDATDMMAMMAFKFSTTLVAAGKTKLLDEIEREKAITIFAPDNNGWMNLGIQNIQHLFSPHGEKDLKKILKYHIVVDDTIAYSEKLMEENERCFKTLLKKEELCVCAHDREDGKAHKDRKRRHRRGGNTGRCAARKGLGEGKHEGCEPKNWVFSINDGESRITIPDILAENGVIHPISSVLIPPDVDLPHERAKDNIEMV
ncbi:FAS1 domain-containing protein [Cladochytrium replicatum]|nr:FAS1 domain-containing protein [Cladochytrium replicatum]